MNLAILVQAPDDAGALTRLGRAHRRLGLREDAASAFGRALAIDPQNRIARKHFLELAAELKAG